MKREDKKMKKIYTAMFLVAAAIVIFGITQIPTGNALQDLGNGTYILEDTDAGKLKDNKLAEIRNKKIGFVFQTFNLLSKNNVIGNVELPLIYSAKNKVKDRKSKIINSQPGSYTTSGMYIILLAIIKKPWIIIWKHFRSIRI